MFIYKLNCRNLSRRCTNATKVKGINIPLDMSITVDVFSIHSDPEIWGPVDPSVFYPLRFV
jgi:cytochrome P450